MQVYLLSLKHFEKTFFVFLIMILPIFMFLAATVPLSIANGSASTMQAPGPGTIPTIDGVWSAGEWDDALEYSATNSSLTSYVRVKWNGSFFYILIDSPWDTTNSSVFPNENTWIAFDTNHTHGAYPDAGDYLFLSSTVFAFEGDGTRWNAMPLPSGFKHESSTGDWGPGVQPSPKNSTPHRIDEFKVPLTYVGQINQTVGLYFMVVDDIDDPDGSGDLGSPTYVEWPENSGGRSDGWPPPPQSRDPCPVPSAWGHLALLQSPTAAFTWDPFNPDAGEIVTFNATGSQDDGSVVNYAWDFGDENAAMVSAPLTNHTFSAAGSYTVNLTVTDNDGLNNSVVHTVNVGVVATFAFSPPTPNPGDVVTFNATGSYAPGGTIVNYTWDWDDTSNNMTANPIIGHTFSTGGSYNVNLTVTDNFARQAWVMRTVNVGVPVANFTFWSSKPNAGDAVIFDASASSDPDGTIANYTWNYDDGNIITVSTTIITHTFSTNGSYAVNLTVTDNTGLNGSVVDTVTVYTSREAHFSFSPSTPNVGDDVTFNASRSKDPRGTIANYTWNFNDGSTTTVDAPTDTIIHIFSAGGSYNVNLTITDNDGLKSWYNNTVNVGIPPVQATAPFSPMFPTIDGVWSADEWTDANEYTVSGPGGESHMMIKWGPSNITGDFLYILIDSTWDTTNATAATLENIYVAFDTEHDKSTVGPQLDDYLFNGEYSYWSHPWKGDGTKWAILWETEINITGMGYTAMQGRGSSPRSDTIHRIDEFRIPLEFVGAVNQTSGFYVIVIDDSSDEDGWGLNLPPTAWVEWPAGAGGDPRGWPEPPYIDPCPTHDKWGYLIFEPPTKASSNVTLDFSSSSITLGESVTISGTVSNSTGAIAGVNVRIQYCSTGTTAWNNATTVTSDSTGRYTYDWTPTEAGTYEIKASWAGNADIYGAESEVKMLEVASEAIPILVIVATVAVVAVVAAIAVYLLKIRKPKR